MFLGILLFAGFAFQTSGLIYTTPSKSAFITGFSVILVRCLSLFHGYRLTLANAAGAALGLLGLYFLVVPAGIGSVNRGDVLTFLGPWRLRFTLFWSGTTRVAIPSSIWRRPRSWWWGLSPAWPFPRFPTGSFIGPPVWSFAIAVTAVFATAFCFSTQVWAQQYTPPAQAALIFALEPVFAALDGTRCGA